MENSIKFSDTAIYIRYSRDAEPEWRIIPFMEIRSFM